jgi:peroxiredoxin
MASMWRGASKQETEPVDAQKPLRETLAEMTANVATLIPADKLAPPLRAADELRASGAEQRILAAGALAPEFGLRDQHGKIIRSADLLQQGRLIVVFFRGRWDPYCVATLEAWQARWWQLRQSGVGLVAISPQTPHHSEINAEQHQLTFRVLSDPGNAVARQFGLVWCVPEYLREHYRSIFINLAQVNGDPSWELPLPAAYCIDRDATVLYAEAHADFRIRPEPREVIAMASEPARA